MVWPQEAMLGLIIQIAKDILPQYAGSHWKPLRRVCSLACEKGASNWHTVIPLKDMDFDLKKREVRDAVRRFDMIGRYPIIRQYTFVGASLQ